MCAIDDLALADLRDMVLEVDIPIAVMWWERLLNFLDRGLAPKDLVCQLFDRRFRQCPQIGAAIKEALLQLSGNAGVHNAERQMRLVIHWNPPVDVVSPEDFRI